MKRFALVVLIVLASSLTLHAQCPVNTLKIEAGSVRTSGGVIDNLCYNPSTGKLTLADPAFNKDGSNLKQLRVASCATAASIGATCDTTVTWTTAFADNNYSPVCSISVVTNQPRLINVPTQAASNITVRIEAVTAAAASGTINCIAIHD